MIKELRDALYGDLALTRERGYQVATRAPERQHLGTLFAEMANSEIIDDYKREATDVIHRVDQQMCAPVKLVEAKLYDVSLIACPIFDPNGGAAFNLCLGGFPRQLTGDMLLRFAERLSRTCLEIMQSTRTQAMRQIRALSS